MAYLLVDPAVGSPYDGMTLNGINNSDRLAVDGIGPGSTALFYAGGQARRVDSVDGGCTSALSINEHGDIVGSAKNGDGGAPAQSGVYFVRLATADGVVARKVVLLP
ncbi:MAG TPA: hypothetical protein VMS93_09595 [Candidatus Saccharimonadales bacterium]|nr:hypothetical protein [Candidatus Saccharimonadales bacterium]